MPHNPAQTVVPYKDSDSQKKEQVEQMFNNIAHRYDLLNRTLSFGIDVQWRKKVVKLLMQSKPQLVLDMATGTADLALAIAKKGVKSVKGVDLSEGMLQIGRQKTKQAGLTSVVELVKGDSEQILFNPNTFDAATVAFGVRNFQQLQNGLNELNRVIKPGGQLLVLEFSKPKLFPFKQVYHFYFHYLLPFVGRLISKDASAYSYLPASVDAFPDGEDFCDFLRTAGFDQIKMYSLTFGTATIYSGVKR